MVEPADRRKFVRNLSLMLFGLLFCLAIVVVVFMLVTDVGNYQSLMMGLGIVVVIIVAIIIWFSIAGDQLVSQSRPEERKKK
jgi:hypothetical protein